MTNSSSAPVDEISAFFSQVGPWLDGLPARINRWWEEKQHAHRRAALLEAYRRRRHWRKADIPKLRALGVCSAADRRLQRIESAKSPGRGVIRSYSPLDETLTAGIAHLGAYFDPATPPAKRLALLKKTRPWWPYVVEALYRGEYHARKSSRTKSPSEIAEQEVARHLGVSPAIVRKLCTAVRQERGAAPPDCPAIPVAHFDAWLQKGGSIWPEDSPMSDGL